MRGVRGSRGVSPGSSLRAASSAILRRGPAHGHPDSTSIPALLESRCADSSPPTTGHRPSQSNWDQSNSLVLHIVPLPNVLGPHLGCWSRTRMRSRQCQSPPCPAAGRQLSGTHCGSPGSAKTVRSQVTNGAWSSTGLVYITGGHHLNEVRGETTGSKTELTSRVSKASIRVKEKLEKDDRIIGIFIRLQCSENNTTILLLF